MVCFNNRSYRPRRLGWIHLIEQNVSDVDLNVSEIVIEFLIDFYLFVDALNVLSWDRSTDRQ